MKERLTASSDKTTAMLRDALTAKERAVEEQAEKHRTITEQLEGIETAAL